MTIKLKRQLLRLTLHGVALAVLFAALLINVQAQSEGAAGTLLLLFLGYLATLRVNPLPRLLERRLISEADCQFCGALFDLVGIWPCGCGFVTWQSRHALSSCPSCGKEYQWLQCPRCDASIKT